MEQGEPAGVAKRASGRSGGTSRLSFFDRPHMLLIWGWG
jgi:hypothetical protein